MDLTQLQGAVHHDLALYALRQYRSSALHATAIVPKAVSLEQVQSAWANAVKYTAKGVDLADHDAAIKRMLERHPSWGWLPQPTIPTVAVKLSYADQDTSEIQADWQDDYSATHKVRLVQLKGYNVQYPNRPQALPMLTLLPAYTQVTTMVRNAWAYAVRYSANALEDPNHDQAAQTMVERHTDWAVIVSEVTTLKVDLALADNDVADA
jgi:hypothetical protein